MGKKFMAFVLFGLIVFGLVWSEAETTFKLTRTDALLVSLIMVIICTGAVHYATQK